MTVETDQARITYVGDGTSVTFSVPWKFFNPDDLTVLLAGYATNAFSVSGGNGTPGAVTMSTAPVTGVAVQIFLDPPLTQLVKLADGTGFPSDTLNQINDRAVQLLQRIQDQLDRTIKAPDGDLSPQMSLPNAANRKSQFLYFDANGNLAIGVTVPAGTFSQAATAAFMNPITPAESIAGVVPLNQLYGELDHRRYLSAVATDIFTAVQTAITVAKTKGGGAVRVAGGAWNVPSSVLAATPWELGDSVFIQGDGAATTSITVTGATAINAIFHSLNIGNQRVRGITFNGNGIGTSTATGRVWHIEMNASAAVKVSKFSFEDNVVSNMGGDYLVHFNNQSAVSMRDIRVSKNDFISMPGNDRLPTNVGARSTCVAFEGSFTSVSGTINDAYVSYNTHDCTYMKNFAISWHGSSNHWYSYNTVNNCGQANVFVDDVGCYAFLAYDNAHIGSPPDRIYWDGNTILSPRDCGIYTANVGRVGAYYNEISGQTSTADASLPKGAIAINGAAEYMGVGNRLNGNYFGLSITPPDNGKAYSIGDSITGVVAGGLAVKVSPLTGNANTVDIRGLKADGAGSGVSILCGSTYAILNLHLDGNIQMNGAFDVSFGTLDATTPNNQYVDLDGLVLGGNPTSYHLSYRSQSAARTRATFRNIKFLGTSGTVVQASFVSSLGLTIDGMEFNDYATGTGFCIETTGAKGRMKDVQFNGVAGGRRYATSGSEELGVDVPTWTGNANDFVQDLNTTELGSAASKYMREGWRWDATLSAWKEQRCLTGN